MVTATPHYHRVAKALHWGMALLIIGMLASGLLMDQVAPLSLRIQVYQLHKSIGITLLFLTCFRIYWRLRHPAPPLPESMKPIEKLLAHAAHMLLYVLMLAMPLSGWLMVSASGKYPTLFFLLFEMPHLPVPSGADAKALHHLTGTIHEFSTQFILIPLLGLHIIAALVHHFIHRDTVLTRMLPSFSRRPS